MLRVTRGYSESQDSEGQASSPPARPALPIGGSVRRRGWLSHCLNEMIFTIPTHTGDRAAYDAALALIARLEVTLEEADGSESLHLALPPGAASLTWTGTEGRRSLRLEDFLKLLPAIVPTEWSCDDSTNFALVGVNPLGFQAAWRKVIALVAALDESKRSEFWALTSPACFAERLRTFVSKQSAEVRAMWVMDKDTHLFRLSYVLDLRGEDTEWLESYPSDELKAKTRFVRNLFFARGSLADNNGNLAVFHMLEHFLGQHFKADQLRYNTQFGRAVIDMADFAWNEGANESGPSGP